MVCCTIQCTTIYGRVYSDSCSTPSMYGTQPWIVSDRCLYCKDVYLCLMEIFNDSSSQKCLHATSYLVCLQFVKIISHSSNFYILFYTYPIDPQSTQCSCQNLDLTNLKYRHPSPPTITMTRLFSEKKC